MDDPSTYYTPLRMSRPYAPGASVPGGTLFSMGFDFRAALAFVTDAANDVFVGGLDEFDYPILFNNGSYSTNAGWVRNGGNVDERDRNAGNNAKLAGVCFHGSTSGVYFRVDLPAVQNYKIRAACGDPNYSSVQQFRLTDGAGADLINVSDASVAANSFLDAGGTERTHANWLTSNAQITVAVTADHVRAYLINSSGNSLSHLEIVNA